MLNNFEATSVYDFWVVGVDTDGENGIDLRVPFIEIDHGNLGELVYLRGVTTWDPEEQMVHQGEDIYEIIVPALAVGDYEFKIGGAEWGVDIGWGNFTVHADSVAMTDPGNGNIALNVPAENDYTFTLDASDPSNYVLTVISAEVPPYVDQGDLFLKGELNGWSNAASHLMSFQGNGAYKTTVAVDSSSFDYTGDTEAFIDFAIANADWSYKLTGASATMTAGGTVTLDEGNSSNNLLDPTTVAGYYDFTLDASTDTTAPTLTMTANSDYTFGDYFGNDMYVRGSFDGWGAGTVMVQTGNVFEVTLTAVAAGDYEFKFASADWTDEAGFGTIKIDDSNDANVAYVQSGGIALTQGGGTNIAVTIPSTGDYVFTLDVTNPLRLVYTVAAVPAP